MHDYDAAQVLRLSHGLIRKGGNMLGGAKKYECEKTANVEKKRRNDG